ncbi:MAG: hypothetical protein ACI906_000237 [Candidatus Latescibacterota bacterium]
MIHTVYFCIEVGLSFHYFGMIKRRCKQPSTFEETPMAFSPSFLFWPLATSLALLSCTPLVVPPQTPAEEQDAYERDRYQVKIVFDPAQPQTITGFLRLARVSSGTMGSASAVLAGGSPRDLDIIIDSIDDLTAIEAEFGKDLLFSDPALLELPIIVPQIIPDEIELEQLVAYLMAGGFVLDIELGLESYREGLERYGELVWGRDARVEHLPDDHPLYSAYFNLPGGIPAINMAPLPGRSATNAIQPIKGLYINDRLAGISFPPLGQPRTSSGALTGTTDSFTEITELSDEVIIARKDRRNDPRIRQMLVNIVVFALTQEGSIAARTWMR